MSFSFFTSKIILTQNSIYLRGAFYFAIYSLIVSFIYFFISSDYNYLIPAFNYIYCFIFLFFVSNLMKNKLFYKVTFWALLIALGIQFILFNKLGLNYDSGRYMIMFQNPNQLGLWGLIVILILISINQNISLKWPFILYIGIIIASFFVIASISQAAIIVLVLLLLLYLFLIFRKRPITFIFIFIVASSVLITYLDQTILEDNLLTKVLISRFDSDLLNENDNDNNLEARNYNRIWENPEYLIFGAGESGLNRFGNDTNEIHSTFGSLLFSYGLVGFLLFSIPLFKVSMFPLRKNSYIFLFFLLFSLTHNVLRWPLFWILPYLMFFVKKNSYVRN